MDSDRNARIKGTLSDVRVPNRRPYRLASEIHPFRPARRQCELAACPVPCGHDRPADQWHGNSCDSSVGNRPVVDNESGSSPSRGRSTRRTPAQTGRALRNGVSTGWTSLGDTLITRRISLVAPCCSSASFRRCSRCGSASIVGANLRTADRLAAARSFAPFADPSTHIPLAAAIGTQPRAVAYARASLLPTSEHCRSERHRRNSAKLQLCSRSNPSARSAIRSSASSRPTCRRRYGPAASQRVAVRIRSGCAGMIRLS